MGMKAVRAARKFHSMPRQKNVRVDVSGLRGVEYRSGSVLRDAGDPPSAPTKHRPFAQYPVTGTPPASEETTWKSQEGKKLGKQADKSSKETVR